MQKRFEQIGQENVRKRSITIHKIINFVEITFSISFSRRVGRGVIFISIFLFFIFFFANLQLKSTEFLFLLFFFQCRHPTSRIFKEIAEGMLKYSFSFYNIITQIFPFSSNLLLQKKKHKKIMYKVFLFTVLSAYFTQYPGLRSGSRRRGKKISQRTERSLRGLLTK